MASQKSVKKLVNEFVSDLKKCNITLKKAFLFGSYANGKANSVSDIDVAIVADEFNGLAFNDPDYFINIKIKKKNTPQFKSKHLTQSII